MPIPTNVPFYIVVSGSFEPVTSERKVEDCTWAGTVEDISRMQFEDLSMVIEVGTGRNVADRMVREAAHLRAERCDDYSHKFFQLVELHLGTRAARSLVREYAVMAIHVINGVKIHTSFDYPPIPVRSMDWSAVTDDYDCDCDQDGFFSTSPAGHGATEAEAIADLVAQLEMDA